MTYFAYPNLAKPLLRTLALLTPGNFGVDLDHPNFRTYRPERLENQ